MASIFAQAAVPLVAMKAFPTPATVPAPESFRRRLAASAVICAILPDLDVVTFAFEIRSTELVGHRGISHSLLTALLVGLVFGVLLFRSLGVASRPWWRVVFFLAGATAAHDFLDALTPADVGVALFAPIENGRHFFPLKLVPSPQVGIDEYLGLWGLLTLANEIIYVVFPVATIASLVRGVPERRRTTRAIAIWAFGTLGLRLVMPDWFTATVPRVIAPYGSEDAGDPNDIPRDGLPDQTLVTRFDELRARRLFDVDLAPSNATWSSTFFPSWFGGEAGRWRDGTPILVWRTLTGFSPPNATEAKALLARSATGDGDASRRIAGLAPAEKLDLALERFDFPATVQALGHSHNGHPRYWSGRCNGVATAALYEPEPFRVVDVVTASGAHVAFHPNDVKSLLSVAYYTPRISKPIGAVCRTVSFDAGATCSMNAAVLVLALTNRLGLAHDSFLVDALPTIAKQYYAVARARIDVVNGPYPYSPASGSRGGGVPIDPRLAPRVASLVDVALELTLSSTTLSHARADVLDPAAKDPTRYARVGLVPVVMKYRATLALDGTSEIVGGRWIGDPPDGPDNVVIVGGGPAITADGNLEEADRMPWALIQELARASADAASTHPTLDLRAK